MKCLCWKVCCFKRLDHCNQGVIGTDAFLTPVSCYFIPNYGHKPFRKKPPILIRNTAGQPLAAININDEFVKLVTPHPSFNKLNQFLIIFKSL